MRLLETRPIRSSLRDAVLVRASDVHPEPIDWLWQDRVPFGVVTVFAGAPGVGKSTVNYDLAARTTRDAREVLIVTAEDHLSAVVRPRLEAAGADLDRVRIWDGDLELPTSVPTLAALVEEHRFQLVILDPLVAFIGDGTNTHRDHHVRRVLAPLGAMAEQTGAAVVVVIHTNKGMSADPLMRISGSVGFTGAARSVLVAADDPKDDSRRILAVAKSNLARFPAPLAYELVGSDLADGIATSKVRWLGEAPDVDVRELLATPERREGRQDEARRFLIAAGILVVARPAADLEDEATSAGIAARTLRRARQDLDVPVWREGFPARTWWGPQRGQESGQPNPGQLANQGGPAETLAEGPSVAKLEGLGEAGA